MKTKLVLLGFFLISISSVSQDITGQWNGLLKVGGMQLRVVFHITQTPAGLSATMDSPDQGAKGIPMTSVKYENKVLTLELTTARIVYSGILDKPGFVTGNFVQAGQSFPMNLSRNEIVLQKTKKPQEPEKPYPYKSEDISFVNSKDSIELSGTLTLPTVGNNFSAVVMITGSGPQNRDEELMGHKPFLIISDYLTRNGIAVLRYDDRGTFASKGVFSKATTFDFATDVEAAISYLKTRKEINPSKIGLIGHSEGGIIAPIVAARNKDVDFIVLLAGTGIPGSEILLRQQDLIGRANGMKESDLKTTKDLNTEIYKMIDEIQNPDSLKAKVSTYLLEKSKDIPELKVSDDKTVNDIIEQQISQLISPWMLNFIRYNPAPIMEKVKCPVLAMNGSKDLQVPADINLPAIEKALKKGGNKQFIIKEFPGLNHLFQECKTGSPNEYTEIEQTISPVVLETITKWINALK